MAAARVERARQDGAAAHAIDLLTEAENALREAKDALSARRSYREALRAAARACIRADEARRKAQEEMGRIHRLADRLLKECRALIEEARSMDLDPALSEELDFYSDRVDSIQTLFEESRVSEGHDSAWILKNDLLDFLKRQKEKRSHKRG
jgi:hypothetical protein